ncbi:hypothetical protein BC834DRAFT_911310 [Gloeopeniophorella convolvens]|nr:hypothetical protein BC834DRAFT_911310 [Gloeopeniophorella convolvens]
MFIPTAATVACIVAVLIRYVDATGPRPSFSVHYPWATRGAFPQDRRQFDRFQPFCRDIIRNPQVYSGYAPSFVSFSGPPGDLVSVRYTRKRVPRSRGEFPVLIAEDVPIAPSGQLCFDIQTPTPLTSPEYGVFLFEARDPATGVLEYHCLDVRLQEHVALGADHPAMCAQNNETFIPMPDEYL